MSSTLKRLIARIISGSALFISVCNGLPAPAAKRHFLRWPDLFPWVLGAKPGEAQLQKSVGNVAEAQHSVAYAEAIARVEADCA